MKNRVSAKGGAMAAALPRRSILAGLAALPIAAVPALAGAKAADAADKELVALWRQRRVANAEADAAYAVYSAAADRLPWWAKDGPSMMNSDGELCGEKRNWAAITDQAPPEPGVRRLIRPGPADLRRHYDLLRTHSSELALSTYRRQLRAFAARSKAKMAECAALDLPRLGELADALTARTVDICTAIEELPPATPSIAAAQAGLALISADGLLAEPILREGDAAHLLLSYLRPHINPELAGDIGELIDAPDTPMRDLRIYKGCPADV